MGSGAGYRPRSHDRIEQIIDIATRQIWDGGGLLALNMHGIGAELGASRTMTYSYFRDDSALASAVLSRQAAHLFDNRLDMLARSGSLHERVTSCGEVYLRHLVEHGPVIHYILRDAQEIGLQRGCTWRLLMVFRSVAAEARRALSLTSAEAVALFVMLLAIPEELARLVNAQGMTLDQASLLCGELLCDGLDALRFDTAPA